MYRETSSLWKIYSLINEEKGQEIKQNDVNNIDCPVCEEKMCVESCEEGDICTKCGSLLADNLTFEQEYRYYGAQDSKSSNPQRVGMPTNPNLKSASLGSVITKTYGSKFKRSWEMKQTWIGMNYKDRTLLNIFQNISVKSKNAGITGKIIEEAKKLYCLITRGQENNDGNCKHIFRGTNRKALEASCIYKACQTYNVPRNKSEVAAIFNLSDKDMTKGYNKFKGILRAKKLNGLAKTFTPADYMDRYCSELCMNKDMTELCKHIATKAYNLDIDNEGHTPKSIAAGSIYLVSMLFKLNISKEQIEQITKTSDVTIGKCQNLLNREKDKLLPKEILEQILKQIE